ncbi:MAG: 30S ribosomal protein S1, partial [Clostridia bacterium]|nr:30S ribosomal protein S1 [Clostridia bacterium]
TDMEINDEVISGSEDGSDIPENESVCQTESEITASEEKEFEEKPKRKRKTAVKKNESDTEAKPSPEVADQSEKTPEAEEAVRPIRRVMSIDAIRTVETDAERADRDLIDLTSAMKTGKILSGSLQGVEETKDDAVAVVYRGSYKIIIPAREAILPPDDYRGQPVADVHRYMLTKRLGAEIDYVIKGIDADAGIAVASRLEAMRLKRKQFYFGTDRDGINLLYAGVCAEARVVSVIRAGIFVDLFGLELYIPLRELSYQRMMDASVYFQAGQRVLVKVVSLDRTDKNNIKAVVSVKQAMENPYEKALRRYTVGNRYVGTVSMVDTNGVFVALDGGIDCLCSFPKRGRPPKGARVTVRILGINKETNRIWGAITHTAITR